MEKKIDNILITVCYLVVGYLVFIPILLLLFGFITKPDLSGQILGLIRYMDLFLFLYSTYISKKHTNEIQNSTSYSNYSWIVYRPCISCTIKFTDMIHVRF